MRRIAVLAVHAPPSIWQPETIPTQVIEHDDDAYLFYRVTGAGEDWEARDDRGQRQVAIKHFASLPLAKTWVLQDILLRGRTR